MELEVLDMPKWKEKVIYLVLRLLGYKDQHFMLLDIIFAKTMQDYLDESREERL